MMGVEQEERIGRWLTPIETVIEAASECIPSVGSDTFTERFLRVVTLIGADQATAFAYEDSKATCLMSRNFLSEERSGTLASVYVDGWFREDPVFERCAALPGDACLVLRLEDLRPSYSQRYFRMFFGDEGWRAKVAILVVQDSLRMVLNLYFGPANWSPLPFSAVETAALRLIGRALATHFLMSKASDFPIPLAVLSERERQVCVGMLAGKKAEIIAEEIGIGASSVVTYRQRAYQKLGITSRGQLFSICRS